MLVIFMQPSSAVTDQPYVYVMVVLTIVQSSNIKLTSIFSNTLQHCVTGFISRSRHELHFQKNRRTTMNFEAENQKCFWSLNSLRVLPQRIANYVAYRRSYRSNNVGALSYNLLY